MKKGKTNSITVVVLICIGLFLVIGMFTHDYLKQNKWQTERTARKARINELWQKFMEKDPNEEDFWRIVSKSKSFDLIRLGTIALLKVTNLEKRLLYLFEKEKYHEELRTKISDRILENPSAKALKKIIDMAPERAETALLVLLEIADLNEIGFDCFKDVIRNIPSHRIWAWDKILSKPDQIKSSLCYSFIADSNYPKEAVDAYFAVNLQPKHYKYLIFYAQPPLNKRAFKEFLAVKPKNEDLRELIAGNQWGEHPEKEIKIKAAKYILANNPLERELDFIERKCRSLRKEVREAKKKILEKRAVEQKVIPETKEDILKAIEKIPY